MTRHLSAHLRVCTLVLTGVLMLLPIRDTSAAVLIVDWDGTGDHETIQAGIDAASEGDTVLVMAGTYSGAGNREINFSGTNITLRSASGPDSTTIDCEDVSRGFFIVGEDRTPVIDGFRVVDGANGLGAAVYCMSSTPTFRNCRFESSSASSYGGGMICYNSSPAFTDCTFWGNYAGQNGGGIYLSYASPTFTRCTIEGNSSEARGGGFYCCGASSPVLTECRISGNVSGNEGGGLLCGSGSTPVITDCQVSDNVALYRGGGMYCFYGSPVLANCAFSGNSSGNGAGVFCNQSSPEFTHCTFSENSATSYVGGGVSSYDGSSLAFHYCTFTSNSANTSGGGLYCGGPVTLTNCTLSGNSAGSSGGGLRYCGSGSALLFNCIVVFSTAGEGVSCSATAAATITDSDVYGNAGGDWIGCIESFAGGDGNISADPLFCDAENGDFTLDASSPCSEEMNPGSVLIGAWGVGCDSPVLPASWGRLKAMYR